MPTTNSANPADDHPEDISERKRAIRHRFIGAGIIFLLTVVLWHLGTPIPDESSPLQRISFDLPAAVDDGADDAGVNLLPEIEEANKAFAIAPVEVPEILDAIDAPADADSDETLGEELAAEVDDAVAALASDPAVDAAARSAASGADATGSVDAAAAEESAVEVAVVEPVVAPTTEEEPASRFAVQLGAFGLKESVDRAAARAKEHGFTVQEYTVEHADGYLVRVQATGFVTRAAADEARQRLLLLGFDGATVIDLQ